MIRTRAIVALSTLLIVASNSSSAQAISKTQIEEQKRRIHNMHVQLNQNRNKLQSDRIRESDLRGALAQTRENIGAVNGRLDELRGQIHSNEERLAYNKVQLQAAQETLRRHNDALRRRLVDAYENGSMGYLEVLLSAHSFSEFVERWEDIRFLVAANQRTIRERRDAERKVAEVQAALQNQAAVLDEQNERQERARRQLESLEEQRRNLVAIAERVRKISAIRVSALEESSQEQEDSLQALIVQRQRELEAERAARLAEARRAAQLSGSALPSDSVGAPGDLSWPVSGPITSPFGMRLDPVSGQFTRMHTGIDIAVNSGTSIGAAAAGRVIVAGWNDGGYGNMVVIDHGGGMSTLYGHCSQVYVTAGQDVQRGAAIAAVGSTGHSTGPHLHFEVRMNGQPVDPTSRLR